MIASGLTYRSLVKNNAFSAAFDLSFSNVTGEAQVGFSGSSNKYKFDFVSGKMFDNEGRYFSSYQPDESFSLSTNFSGAAYDYSLDNEIFTYSGAKANFNVENFYIDPSGVNVNNSITINSNKPTLTLSSPSSFVSGQNITGYLVTDSVNGVKLFTGSFEDLSSFEFVSLPSNYITSTSSGQAIFKQKEASLGDFTTAIELDTNAGSYSQNVEITAVEDSYLDYTFEYSEDSTNSSGTAEWSDALSQVSNVSGALKSAETSFDYSYNTNLPSLEPSSLPLSISFSYYTGTTGNFGLLSNVSVTSGGNGYLSSPNVVFQGGGASTAASGSAELGTTVSNFDQVQNIDITSRGIGYTSAPTVVFSSGTGILNNQSPTTASGTASVAVYEKSFTGAFNIYTGVSGNYVNFRESSLTSASGYHDEISYNKFNSELEIKIEYLTTFDTENLIGLLTISGVNNNIIDRYITGVK